MNKEIVIEMIESKDIIISMRGSEQNIVIEKNDRKINAKNIYDFLDFSIDDTYKYDVIPCDSPKDTKVLEKLRDLLKSITDQFSDIHLEEKDVEMKEELNGILQSEQRVL